jgi:hypothetical protein
MPGKAIDGLDEAVVAESVGQPERAVAEPAADFEYVLCVHRAHDVRQHPHLKRVGRIDAALLRAAGELARVLLAVLV